MKSPFFISSIIVLCEIAANTSILAAPSTISNFIKIDHFGYRLNDEKIAVISDPQIGFNASLSFTPSTIYQIRDWNTDAVIFAGSPVAWNNGATHEKSGDKVWHFDFSTVALEGSYYVFDVGNNVGSNRFEINDCVYQNILKTACRANFYQRCGVPKSTPYADTDWLDGACHIGVNQDTDCRLWSAPNDASTSKDLSGGWHYQNDYSKYVNFAWEPVIHLLLAYEESPNSWTDDYNIPESGNGVPDILDEVKIELDWILKMQQSDGSVLSVVGTNDYQSSSPPSQDAVNDFRRYYGPATTHASYSAAGMLALASIQFEAVGNQVYSSTLENAALNAWNWAIANPDIKFHNNNQDVSQGPVNGLAGSDQEGWDGLIDYKKLAAAIYLFALTGNSDFINHIDPEVNITNLNFHGSDAQLLPYNDALLYYAKTIGGTSSVQNQIRTYYSASLEAGMNNLPAFLNGADAYRAYISDFNWNDLTFDNVYNWGSNRLKALQGISYQNMNSNTLNNSNALNYTNASSAYVHYLHGVNPLSKLYLSNMEIYGGENSVQQIFHNWFSYGTIWEQVTTTEPGPAPGYLVLGPNEYYEWWTCCVSNCEPECATVANLLDDPAQKCYQDLNLWYPYAPWAITANEMNLQAAYIRLLSKFYDANCGNSSGIDFATALIPGFSFYPNPSSEQITIVLDSKTLETVEIFDAQGRLVQTQEVGNNSTIDISALSKGLYSMRISSGSLLLNKI